MNILADFHHSGLGYSLHLQLEKRLGHDLYFPIGKEWFDRGYWCIAEPYDNSPDTINQYLDLDHRYIPKDGTVSLNEVVDVKPTHYEIADHAHNYVRKCVTWEQFMNMKIDVIIGSIPRHWEMYRQLKDIYKPRTRVVCQMGNMFNEIQDMMKNGVVQNLMASTIEFPIPSWIHKVFYHQEVDERVFTYAEPTYATPTLIRSFVNCLPKPELFSKYKMELNDMWMEAYGAACPDGNVQTIEEMARMMADSHWAWHVKPAGDGFGHVWFDWALIGRPIITNFADYKDKLAGEVFEDGVTGIDLGARSFTQNIQLIRELSHPDRHIKMCREINRRVKEKMNYNQEGERMKKFLQDLR